jgi:hypothetical protein
LKLRVHGWKKGWDDKEFQPDLRKFNLWVTATFLQNFSIGGKTS